MSALDNNLARVAAYDPEVGVAMQGELARQRTTLDFIASENLASEEVLLTMGSVLMNKYAEGYPGKRYYGGCKYIDQVEALAIERACDLFNCDYANVQPHSGSQANLAVMACILDPGDTFMAMDLSNGGHLTHGSPVNLSGRFFNCISYPLDQNGYIDYDAAEKMAIENNPKLIIAGASAYCRKIDFKRFREIADKCGAVLMADIAHIAGLVAVGEHPSPFPYADVVTTTTHKTLRGPRSGLILATKEANEKYNFNKAVFPGMQGGPLMHVIAAKAIALKEAMRPEFKDYQHQIVLNAQALAKGLMDRGLKVVTGGTDNHLLLLDISEYEFTGKDLQERLESVGIVANRNTVPNEKRSPYQTSGVRFGTPGVTSRGLKEEDMDKVADCIAKIIRDYDRNRREVRAIVESIAEKYPIYQY